MKESVAPGKVLELKDLIAYEEGKVVNEFLVQNEHVRFALKAFDAGTSLPPHTAPGDAIVTALEGCAVIQYEGVDYEVKAGENFRFAKGALHSVAAKDGRFKMSLLIVLD